MEEALEAGHASFRLEGEKLHGGWSLRRIEGRRWLLVKRRDEEADSGDPVAERPESVVSGRTIEELGGVIEPMKAVLADKPFSDPDWIFERKLDGIRCLAIKDASGVRLMSRTGRLMNDEFPEIVGGARERALRRTSSPTARSSRSRTGSRASRASSAAAASACRCSSISSTCRRHEGEDLRQLPLRERKARLRRALDFDGPMRFNPHRNGEHGEELYREACRKGLEGVMAKRADSPYLAAAARATG